MSRNKDNTLLNDDIKFSEVRCGSEDGAGGTTQHGLMSSDEANKLAEEMGLDLVLIAPNAKPPVVKIMDYGKFKYQQEKKLKEQRKNQIKVEIKEIKLSVKIAENDIAYKVKHAREFLAAGKHVKFRVFLRGREMAQPQAGREVLLRVWPMVEDVGVMEMAPKFEGRYFNMMVIPQGSAKK